MPKGKAAITDTLPQKRRRRAPLKWQKIINEACALKAYEGKGFNYSDVLKIAESHDVKITRESLRVKLERYRKSEYLKKISRGHYQVSPKGYHFFASLE